MLPPGCKNDDFSLKYFSKSWNIFGNILILISRYLTLIDKNIELKKSSPR